MRPPTAAHFNDTWSEQFVSQVCLQDPGSYASTAIIRMETKADLGTDAELVVACVHQKVFEAYWQDGETFPSRVVVDDVLN